MKKKKSEHLEGKRGTSGYSREFKLIDATKGEKRQMNSSAGGVLFEENAREVTS